VYPFPSSSDPFLLPPFSLTSLSLRSSGFLWESLRSCRSEHVGLHRGSPWAITASVFGAIWKGPEGEPWADSALVRLSVPVYCPWVCNWVRTTDDYPEDTTKTPSRDLQSRGNWSMSLFPDHRGDTKRPILKDIFKTPQITSLLPYLRQVSSRLPTVSPETIFRAIHCLPLFSNPMNRQYNQLSGKMQGRPIKTTAMVILWRTSLPFPNQPVQNSDE